MKRILAIVLFSTGIIQTNFAQVGIGTANPDSSSILEIQSTSKGVLFPKVALQGANIVAPLSNPAKGLIVWNTGTAWGSAGFYYNDSNSVTPNWTKVASGAVMKTTLTDGKIWIGNASNIATEQDITGDLTITNAGVGTISNNAVTSAKILNGTIANADIANNAVSGTKINITGNTDGSFMYYDGVDWVNLAPDTAGKILQTNGAGAPVWVNANTLNVNNIYTTDGTLTGNRIVSQGANKLTFLSSSINGFNVNDTMFSVDAANNRIGIGTTTPSFPIHEKRNGEGSIFIENTASGGGSVALFTPSATNTGGVGTWTNHDFPIFTNNTDRVTVKAASGDVGIGTANPFGKLHVFTNSNPAATIQSNSTVGTWLSIGNTDTAGGTGGKWFNIISTGTSNGQGPGKLIFFRATGPASAASPIMTMDWASSNIGIGITNPANRLDIASSVRSGTHGTGFPLYVTGPLAAGSAGSAGIEFRHENGTQGIGFGFNTMYATGSNISQDLGLRSKGTGNLNFSTDASPRMFISGTNGRVGIGTTNPGYLLDLNGGTFGFGINNQRTETRDSAGKQGSNGAQSGFFETENPINYPAGASGWWHLIDTRHNNKANNYAMQIAGSFYDQDIYFRKTNNSETTAWSKLLTTTSGWTVKGNSGTNDPAAPVTYGTTNFASNENWIGTTDGNDIAFGTNSIERMRIKQTTGFVGIGTPTPNASLEIGGNPTNAIRTPYINISGNNTNTSDRPYIRGLNDHLVISPRTTGNSTMYYSYPGDLTFGTTVATRIQESIFISATGSAGGGNVGIGTSTPNASAILDLTSTTKGFLPPRMNSAQRDAITGTIPEGLMIYNIDINCPEWFDTKSDPPGGPTGGFWNSHCFYCENTFAYNANSNGNGFFTQAGSPVNPQKWCVWINPGITLGANTQGGTALNFSGLPAGSEVIVYNYGSIIGGGGNGGGGAQQSDLNTCGFGSSSALGGNDGGAAITTSANVKVKIYNYGIIAGGGGGGGGGAGGCKSAGGGGGGGRGIPGGNGGYGWAVNSSGYTATTSFWCSNCQAGPGSFPGSVGSAASAGTGNCSKGVNASATCGNAAATGGCGGTGGNYATTGNNGTGSNCGSAPAGAGGAGGAALNGNGSNSILINFVSGVNYGTVTP